MQEWLELANGCICCSVKLVSFEHFYSYRLYHLLDRVVCLIRSRDSGVNAIESLMERRGAFDYILLETTGLADPGNIAPIFWVDDGLGSSIYLDGIVTVVDAKNIMKNLDDRGAISANEGTGQLPVGLSPTDAKSFKADDGSCVTTAHLQISHADVIIVNKADLVSESVLREIQERVRSINSLAKIHTTHHSRIPRLEEVLLDIHAYDQVDRRTLDDVATKGRSVSKLDPVSLHMSITAVLKIFILTAAGTDNINHQSRSSSTAAFSAGAGRCLAPLGPVGDEVTASAIHYALISRGRSTCQRL